MADQHPHHHDDHDPVAVLWHMEGALNRAAERGKALLDTVFDERAGVWAALVANGVEQKEIAERAGVDPSDVSRALSTRGL